MMSRVSVVIPAFNAESFIEETVESVMRQTFRDLDIIVVDDGSTDGTLQRLADMVNSVRVIRQSRGGPAKARNLGAASASGEWVAFLDADDVWAPEKIDRQLELAERSNAALIICDRINTGSRGSLPVRQSDIQPLFDGDIYEQLLTGNFITTSTVLLRREVFDAVGRFSEDPILPPAEDWDLWLRVAETYRVAACPDPLVYYRHHQLGASRNPDRMNRARRRVIARALTRDRAKSLSALQRRRILSHTWATNGWDSARHGHRTKAFWWYLRSLVSWPLRKESYTDIVRLCFDRL
jgi:glycosyltransferase involved in cell wall biosynthesis